MTGFDDFDNLYGPPRNCERPGDPEIAEYQGRLPAELLDRWRKVGRCTYGDGLLWITDPGQLDDVAEDWLTPFGIDEGIVFLRTAFAHLYVWANQSVQSIDVQHGGLSTVTSDLDLFFSLLVDEDIRDRILRVTVYEEAKERLGPPERDECYAFVPALALGGAETADSVQRVKIREHLGVLAQLVLGS